MNAKEKLKQRWAKALQVGECPFFGCDLTKKTCYHLDRYLQFGDDTYFDKKTKQVKKNKDHIEVSLVFTDQIEERVAAPPTLAESKIWSFFKKIRKYGLGRDQVSLLVRKFGVGMPNRQILEEMGWTSHSALERRLKQALRDLKVRGFKKEGRSEKKST